MAEYKLSFTAEEIDEKLKEVKTTDQTYNPESENAQSGKAVAEAITNAIGGVNAALNLIIGGEENADNT